MGCYHGVRFDLPALSIPATPDMLLSEEEAGVAPTDAGGTGDAKATSKQKERQASQKAEKKVSADPHKSEIKASAWC